jgi:hypothetical protein
MEHGKSYTKNDQGNAQTADVRFLERFGNNDKNYKIIKINYEKDYAQFYVHTLVITNNL